MTEDQRMSAIEAMTPSERSELGLIIDLLEHFPCNEPVYNFLLFWCQPLNSLSQHNRRSVLPGYGVGRYNSG